MSRPDRSVSEQERTRFGPGIYLHFPFCRQRCGYCDFYVVIGSEDSRRRYVDDLASEIELTASDDAFNGERFRSIFFGGGTPSLLGGEEMARILEVLRRSFDLSDDVEITVECNPESIDPEKLSRYREAGVNRISLGVQAMNETDLELLDRLHGVDQVRRRVSEAREAGFSELSLDLIYGLPNGSVETWRATLESALALAPTHLSSYLLTMEPHVPLARRLREDPAGLVAPPDERAASEYRELQACAEQAGLVQYEISNFASVGSECRHNENYWVRGDYLGFGPSAHSHRSGHRWANIPSLTGYRDAIGHGQLPRVDEERVGQSDVASEWLFLGLRRSEGIPWAVLEESLSERSVDAMRVRAERLTEAGLLEMEAGRLRLTSDAYFVSNSVFTDLMEAI